ncbi:MAG: hypothetical protein M1840_008670 [Geoglossum simile]|nr:MAG: hypothetical protein M1840_008670 [Geoglossum simile]
MDGLAVAATIIAVVQLTELALKLAHKQVGLGPSRFGNAELQSTSRALYAFNGILQALQTHLRINEEDETRLQTLNCLTEPLNQCKEALGLISGQLENPTFIGKHVIGERFDRKLKKALLVIEDARKLIELALLSDQHIIVNAVERYLRVVAEDVRDIHTTLSESKKRLAEIEDSSREWHQQFQELKLSYDQDMIIRWLQYTDPSTNHNAACEKREPLTGNWLLQSDNFAKWKRESKQFLWLHGIPGCGKTILSSTVVEHIKATCKRDCHCQYIFYYFDFNDSKKQEVASLLRSILAQLASRDLKTLNEVESLYRQNDRGKQQPDKKSLLSVLLSVLQSPPRTYLIIDALDECSQRGEMLKVLSNIYQRCSKEVNILVTSRKEYDIELVLDDLATSIIGIQQTAVDSDIRIHVKNCLAEDVKLKKWPPVVKKEVEDALVRGAHGMFRWVVCQLTVLRDCLKLPALRQKLQELPETLDETYNRILLNIPESCHYEVHAILQWLTYSKRPMSLAEVAEAIAIDRDNQTFDIGNRMLNIYSILGICSSLVALSDRKSTQQNSQTEETTELRLAHYSVKEYLVSRRVQDGRAKRFAVKETEAHEYMGEACLIYLLYFNKPDSLYTGAWLDYPFLQYAAESWYGHRQAIPDPPSKIMDPTMALFDIDGGSQFLNWYRLHDAGHPWPTINLERTVETATVPLYYASLLGILEAVQKALAAGTDANATFNSETVLQAASRGGHSEVVEMLLNAGADVNATTSSGRTALDAASEGDHLKVVERLLNAGADVNTTAKWAALEAAARGGHLKVVDRLLNAGADVNATGVWTELEAASEGGHFKVAERLLNVGADVNATKSNGRTALDAASEGGHLEVVERLLSAGADANATTSRGRTALAAASWGGHPEIVERLLNAGADVNFTSTRTALQAASERGRVEVVERLLNAGADANATTSNGRTALAAASWGGYLEVVERLLNAGADVNASGTRTALQAASESGRVDVVEKLLNAGADANATTSSGRTVLEAASDGGHLEIVEKLLNAGADANATTSRGRTALAAASSGGHLEIVERLLNAGADANATGTRTALTALDAASWRGHVEVVDRLLNAGADVNATGMWTALVAASDGGHLKVVDRLLNAGADVNATKSSGRTVLEAASDGGHLEIVERLLSAGADANATTSSGRTALAAASWGGHPEIVERLLNAGADVNATGTRTALQAASERGRVEVVEKLLNAGADANATTSSGRTALAAASWGGHPEIVERLLNAGADVNAAGTRTALQAASESGRVDVVEKLLNAGADVNATGVWTALQAASEGGHFKVVDRLLNVGADVNATTSNGRTALEAASEGGHLKVVDRLLNAGADVNAAGTRTALDVASWGGHLEIVDRLLAAGADVNANVNDRTALQTALDRGHLEVAKRLRKYLDATPVNHPNPPQTSSR